jgi:hypothetical protein
MRARDWLDSSKTVQPFKPFTVYFESRPLSVVPFSEPASGPSLMDFRAVAEAALARADQLLRVWLPGGHFEGDEYCVRNPTRADDGEGSFKVNRRIGKWADFATGDGGHDLVSLYGYLNQRKNGDAAKHLAADLGLANEPTPHTGGVTLENLACAKKLPLEFLKQAGFSQAGAIIKVNYLTRDNKPMCCRFRVALTGKSKYRWENRRDLPKGVYGRNTLVPGPAKTLLLPEGETCTVTAWLHDREAVGVPGASCAKFLESEDLEGFDTVAILVEPDQGVPLSAPRCSSGCAN